MHQCANKALILFFKYLFVMPSPNQPLEAVELRHSCYPEVKATTQLMLQCAYIISPNIVYSPWRMSKWLQQALLITSCFQIVLYHQTSCTGNPLTKFSWPLQFNHAVIIVSTCAIYELSIYLSIYGLLMWHGVFTVLQDKN